MSVYYRAYKDIDSNIYYLGSPFAGQSYRTEEKHKDLWTRLSSKISGIEAICFDSYSEFKDVEITLLFKTEEIKITACAGYILIKEK